MNFDGKTFQRLLPALQHLAKFSGANRAAICQKHGVAIEDVVAFITKACGALSMWDEDELEKAAKKFDVILPEWKPTAFTAKSVAVQAPAMPARKIPAAPPAEKAQTRSKPVREAPSVLKVGVGAIAPVKLSPEADLGRWLDVQRVKIVEKVSTFVIEVTPELATAWLNFNMANRKPSQTKIRRFVQAIKTQRWTINGESIKFSRTGRLIDGQSRLMAVVEAGLPAILEVRAGLPDVAQESMDSGEIRRGSHTLEMMGETNPGILAPALRQVWLWERGWLGGYPFGVSRVMENQEIKPLLEKHSGIKQSVGWVVSEGNKIKNLMALSDGAALHYLLGLADSKLRDSFFEALVDGVGLTKVSPVYHLREKLLECRNQAFGSNRDAGKVVRAALTIKAWNAARAGQKMTGLIWRKNGPLAEKFPVLEIEQKGAA